MEYQSGEWTGGKLLFGGVLAIAVPLLICLVDMMPSGKALGIGSLNRIFFLLAFLPVAGLSFLVGAGMVVMSFFSAEDKPNSLPVQVTRESEFVAGLPADQHELPPGPISELV